MENEAQRPRSFSLRGMFETAATAHVAAAFVGTLVYFWAETALRLIFTYYPTVPATYDLWSGYEGGRAGDVAAMLVTMTGAGLIAYLLARFLFRGRQGVGSVGAWTLILIVTAIAAPVIGEIGTPIGI